jgi:hypothetical protein
VALETSNLGQAPRMHLLGYAKLCLELWLEVSIMTIVKLDFEQALEKPML